MTVNQKGSTLFISNDPLNPRNGYCDPNEHRDTCVYYVAVSGGSETSLGATNGATFTITAATSADVTLITCDDDTVTNVICTMQNFRLFLIDFFFTVGRWV
jgi:hypothetical protein